MKDPEEFMRKTVERANMAELLGMGDDLVETLNRQSQEGMGEVMLVRAENGLWEINESWRVRFLRVARYVEEPGL